MEKFIEPDDIEDEFRVDSRITGGALLNVYDRLCKLLNIRNFNQAKIVLACVCNRNAGLLRNAYKIKSIGRMITFDKVFWRLHRIAVISCAVWGCNISFERLKRENGIDKDNHKQPEQAVQLKHLLAHQKKKRGLGELKSKNDENRPFKKQKMNKQHDDGNEFEFAPLDVEFAFGHNKNGKNNMVNKDEDDDIDVINNSFDPMKDSSFDPIINPDDKKTTDDDLIMAPPKMKSYKILDLAKAFSSDAKIKYIGIRPGEKINEELISINEARSTINLNNYYAILSESNNFVIKKYKNKKRVPKNFSFSSHINNFLTIKELKMLIKNENIESK